jgi:hypothetical protein
MIVLRLHKHVFQVYSHPPILCHFNDGTTRVIVYASRDRFNIELQMIKKVNNGDTVIWVSKEQLYLTTTGRFKRSFVCIFWCQMFWSPNVNRTFCNLSSKSVSESLWIDVFGDLENEELLIQNCWIFMQSHVRSLWIWSRRSSRLKID